MTEVNKQDKEIKDPAVEQQEAPKEEAKEQTAIPETEDAETTQEEEENEAPKEEKKEDKGVKGIFKKKDNKKSELEETKIKLVQTNDKYLRLYSEFENYRKRTAREKTDLMKTASERTMLVMLPVIDDMDRAMKAFNEAEDKDYKVLKEGLDLIHTKLSKTLIQEGLKEMDCMGEEFDADSHEALTQIPAPSEDMKGKIIEVIEKGYTLNEKVIRFPKVIIGQ